MKISERRTKKKALPTNPKYGDRKRKYHGAKASMER
jgi:hypothetical protein